MTAMTDAERQELERKVREANKRSSQDKSGKRG